MKNDVSNPQINVSKIALGGGIAGAIFTIGSMVIFLLGIPLLRYIFPAAIALGCAVALILHFVRHETPGTPWLLSVTEKETAVPSDRRHNRPQLRRILLNSPTAC
jgi:sugar phosphate permease